MYIEAQKIMKTRRKPEPKAHSSLLPMKILLMHIDISKWLTNYPPENTIVYYK